jgi:DNA-binding HxlR family transcriptional regulator
MHERTTHDTSNCSIARTLEVIGEKWTILILREAWYGVCRFADLEAVLGCPRNLLAARLRMLVDEGILVTEPYQEPGERRRQQYQLSPKGQKLIPAVMALLDWGDEYKADPEGPAVCIGHRECGSRVHVELRCTAGHRLTDADDLEPTPGPAFRLSPVTGQVLAE